MKALEMVKDAFQGAKLAGQSDGEALEAALEQLREELGGDEALGEIAYELERLGWTLPANGAETAKDLRCAISDGFDSVLGDKEKGR